MSDPTDPLDRLHGDLGLKPLRPGWAKLEIFLGLAAAGLGLLLGGWAVGRPEPDWLAAGAGLALFVLGGYLALAGHRSHLYQSNNRLTAYLADEIRRRNSEGRDP